MKSKGDCSSCAILGRLVKMPWEFPNKASHVRHTLCQVLKQGNKRTSDSEYSCPCYYSQIKCLGLHVVYIVNTLCYIRIKKHLHNQIEIIEWKGNNQNILELQGIWIVTPLLWGPAREGGPMSPVWILKHLVSVFINVFCLLSALPSLSQFGRGRLSLVTISFYALLLLFGPSRLSEFTLAGPHEQKSPLSAILSVHNHHER